VLLNLVPITSDSDASTSMLVGVDAQSEYLFPVMCAIENQNNKVFLVKDTSDSALKALEADNLKFVLTSGAASQCSPLALLATSYFPSKYVTPLQNLNPYARQAGRKSFGIQVEDILNNRDPMQLSRRRRGQEPRRDIVLCQPIVELRGRVKRKLLNGGGRWAPANNSHTTACDWPLLHYPTIAAPLPTHVPALRVRIFILAGVLVLHAQIMTSALPFLPLLPHCCLPAWGF